MGRAKGSKAAQKPLQCSSAVGEEAEDQLKATQSHGHSFLLKKEKEGISVHCRKVLFITIANRKSVFNLGILQMLRRIVDFTHHLRASDLQTPSLKNAPPTLHSWLTRNLPMFSLVGCLRGWSFSIAILRASCIARWPKRPNTERAGSGNSFSSLDRGCILSRQEEPSDPALLSAPFIEARKMEMKATRWEEMVEEDKKNKQEKPDRMREMLRARCVTYQKEGPDVGDLV